MIKVSKTVKGDDKMNTKDYIENKKSKKLSDIFKGVLAVGLVVGSMVTSTACKPNQPQESSSSTSTIETTTTTPTIEDPDKEIKIIRCICEAKDRNEIAEELNITLGTLKNYISNILTKLEFDNITKLTIFCLSNGYIVPNQK